MPVGGVNETREPKLFQPQPGESPFADASVHWNAPPGQPVPTQSRVSNVELQTSSETGVPLALRSGQAHGVGSGREQIHSA